MNLEKYKIVNLLSYRNWCNLPDIETGLFRKVNTMPQAICSHGTEIQFPTPTIDKTQDKMFLVFHME